MFCAGIEIGMAIADARTAVSFERMNPPVPGDSLYQFKPGNAEIADPGNVPIAANANKPR
jgi:hypothetical protein